MNKKLKKMLATISAIAVCAISMTSIISNSAWHYENSMGVTPYTVSFNIGDVRYGVWQEMNDYFEDYNCFISENGSRRLLLHNGCLYAIWGWAGYSFENDEDAVAFKKYLTDNNMGYIESLSGNDIFVEEFENLNYTFDEIIQLAKKIKEDTGFISGIYLPESAKNLNITDIVNALPEPTLSGDTDCDDKVNINDAVFVMQSIANPDKYQLSWQGKANADIDGNGITLSDAVTIQEMAASHLYD